MTPTKVIHQWFRNKCNPLVFIEGLEVRFEDVTAAIEYCLAHDWAWIVL
jgi:hypothetical protein